MQIASIFNQPSKMAHAYAAKETEMFYSLLVIIACSSAQPTCPGPGMTNFQYPNYPTIDACQADALTVRYDPRFGAFTSTYCFQQQRPRRFQRRS